MKMILLVAVAAVALLAVSVEVTAADAAKSSSKSAKAAKGGPGRLAHMVAFKFKDTASGADIRKVEEAFAALPGKIPQIASYESGTNVSPEKLDKGFTHAFLLTFRSAKDRDDYLVHPDHQAFGAMLSPYLADVFVIDFWGQKPAKAADKAADKAAKKAK